MTTTCLTAAAIALLAGTLVRAGQPLDIRVTPRQALEPATLAITALVEPDASNRAVRIEAEAATFYRSSVVPLEGEDAPRTTRVEFHGLPGGEYEVRAILLGSDGRLRASVTRDLIVLGAR